MKRLMFVFAVIFFTACTQNKNLSGSNLFKQGQIILPSYAVNDTLVVVNAKELNKKWSEVMPATDVEISEVIFKYCKILKHGK